jgi:hypothetical protein
MYFFYINYPNIRNRTILIHHSDFGQCQNGNGMHGSGSNERGFWACLFKDLNLAEQLLQSLISLLNHQLPTGNHSCCK